MDSSKSDNFLFKLPLYFLYCFAGSISTLYISALDINVIVASSLVGIIASFFTIIIHDENHYSWAAFSGSFAGMISLDFVCSSDDIISIVFLLNTLVISLIVSFMYTLSEYLSFKYPRVFFDGYGGRLGTIAFLSILMYLAGKMFLGIMSFPLSSVNGFFYNTTIWHSFTVLSSVVAAFISMEIKNAVSSLNDNYKVLTVAVTGIIGGLLVTKIPVYGMELGYAWYIGAFVGMSSYFVLMLKRDYIITGVLSGLLYVLSRNMFNGIGGKLGFLSFIAVLITRFGYTFFNFISRLKNRNTEKVIEKIKSGESINNQVVDDDYAQKLVESLQKAQHSGEGIDYAEEITNENFVIGEEVDYSEYQKELFESIHNFEIISPPIKQIIELFQNIGVDCWAFFERSEHEFVPFSYQNYTVNENIEAKFNAKSKFIKTLEEQRRILYFGKNAFTHSFFKRRFSSEILLQTHFIIVFPIFENNQMAGFFTIFEKTDSYEQLHSNLNIIRQYYLELFA